MNTEFNKKESLSSEENVLIKSCMNCTNGSCRVEWCEKVGLDEFGKPQGSECIGWDNPKLINNIKTLKLSKK